MHIYFAHIYVKKVVVIKDAGRCVRLLALFVDASSARSRVMVLVIHLSFSYVGGNNPFQMDKPGLFTDDDSPFLGILMIRHTRDIESPRW